MPHDEMLAELDRRREHAAAMGGEKKLARRRERGSLNAWERLNYLVDDGSFVETGLLGASGMFAEDVAKTPRDGKIAGFARIDGRDVAVCVNDFTVKGASIRRMQASGYPGVIYPIHPRATHIEALPAYPSLGETPEPVDYAYVAIGAEWVPGLLAAAAGNVAFAQVITSGFREEGNAELEDRLVATAHAARVRLVGPNCLGAYSPRDRSLTFPVDAPTEPGRIGIVTQSGGLGTDIIKRGQWKGLGLSALVTAGNCADVDNADQPVVLPILPVASRIHIRQGVLMMPCATTGHGASVNTRARA